MPFILAVISTQRGLKGKERDGDKKADEDVQATGKRRVGPLEAQPLCGLRHVRHEPSLLYTVSLCFACLLVSIFCDACVAWCFSFFLAFFFFLPFLVSFQRAVLEARSTMPMLPLLPSWANCLNGTGVDAFHDQI